MSSFRPLAAGPPPGPFAAPVWGPPGPMAEAGADNVDWHQIARLVRRACPPMLALRIWGLHEASGAAGRARRELAGFRPPQSP